jgi:hypothetical protein
MIICVCTVLKKRAAWARRILQATIRGSEGENTWLTVRGGPRDCVAVPTRRSLSGTGRTRRRRAGSWHLIVQYRGSKRFCSDSLSLFFFALTVTGGLPTGSVDGDNATVPFLVFLALVLFSCATVLYSTVIYTTMFQRIERANAVCELNISQKNIKKGTTYASMETEGLLLISEMINVVWYYVYQVFSTLKRETNDLPWVDSLRGLQPRRLGGNH